MIKNIRHVGLTINNEKKMLNFFIKTLGFKKYVIQEGIAQLWMDLQLMKLLYHTQSFWKLPPWIVTVGARRRKTKCAPLLWCLRELTSESLPAL